VVEELLVAVDDVEEVVWLEAEGPEVELRAK
jgi:hypothetical protein